MELTKSFPPADAFVEMMTEIDYKKHFNTFMDGVENLCLIVAAIATVIAQKWQEHNMTERTQLFVLRVIDGVKTCLLYTSPSPRDRTRSRMPSST